MINKHTFQETFSLLHASEDTVSEVMKMTNTPKRKRLIPAALAAVLAVCLLATTAMAIPAIRNAITGSVKDSWEAATPTDDQGNSMTGTVHQIQLEITMNKNAPEEIETYYMPQLPAEYEQSFGYAYSGLNFDRLGAIYCYWDVPEAEQAGIRFSQLSAHTYETDGMGFSVFLTGGQEPILNQATLGSVEGFLVEAPGTTDGGEKYFCWSDGDYVFYMRFPYSFTEEQMADLITSVGPVEDIRPYMISMTNADLEKTFGQ